MGEKDGWGGTPREIRRGGEGDKRGGEGDKEGWGGR